MRKGSRRFICFFFFVMLGCASTLPKGKSAEVVHLLTVRNDTSQDVTIMPAQEIAGSAHRLGPGASLEVRFATQKADERVRLNDVSEGGPFLAQVGSHAVLVAQNHAAELLEYHVDLTGACWSGDAPMTFELNISGASNADRSSVVCPE